MKDLCGTGPEFPGVTTKRRKTTAPQRLDRILMDYFGGGGMGVGLSWGP